MNGEHIFIGLELNISKEIKKIVCDKNIIANIYRIQANGSIMFGYFFILFIDLILKSKSLCLGSVR